MQAYIASKTLKLNLKANQMKIPWLKSKRWNLKMKMKKKKKKNPHLYKT